MCPHPSRKRRIVGVDMCTECWAVARYGTCENHKVPRPASGPDGLCSKCRNPDSDKNRRQKSVVRARIRVLKLLGGVCAGCGMGDLRVLQIDHVNDDGYVDRLSGKHLIVEVLSGRRGTDDLQLLCANCHHLKSWRQADVWDAVERELSV